MEKIRMVLAIVFVLVILGAGTYIIINWDTVFTSNVEITYPDGCIELYENSDLVSPECVEGRKLVRNPWRELLRNPNMVTPPLNTVVKGNITIANTVVEGNITIDENETIIMNDSIIMNETVEINLSKDEIRRCLDRCSDKKTQKCVDEYPTTSRYNDTVTDDEILNYCSFAFDYNICREECDATDNS